MTPEYEAMRRRNQLAISMMSQNRVNPSNGPWSALANLGQTLAGAYMAKRFGDEEKTLGDSEREKQRQALAEVLAKANAGDRQGAMGVLAGFPGVDYSALATTLATANPAERKTVNVNGVPYYADTQEPVIANAAPARSQIQQNLEAAGYVEGTPEYKEAMKSYIFKPNNKTEVNVGGDRETTFEKKVGEAFAGEYGGLQSAAMNARKANTQLARFDELMKSTTTGPMTPMGMQVKRLASSVGISPESLGLQDNAPASEALEALAKQMVLEVSSTQSGAKSDADMKLFEDSLPSLSKTPGGNKMIIDTLRRMNSRTVQLASLARDYYKRNGRYDEGFYDMADQFDAQNPVFSDQVREQLSGLAAMAPKPVADESALRATNPQTGKTIIYNAATGQWEDE